LFDATDGLFFSALSSTAAKLTDDFISDRSFVSSAMVNVTVYFKCMLYILFAKNNL
ncbi:MAG: hypothetical protein ACI8RD_004919, partial [Bacillariaceae sp.]